jgi:hypothetical protein
MNAEGDAARREAAQAWVWWFGILGLAVAIRWAAAVAWQAQAAGEGGWLRFGDSDSYWVLAGRLAAGESYQYGSPYAKIFRVPLYPLWLAPWRWLIGGELAVLAARLSGGVLGTLCVAMVMWGAGRLGGRVASYGAGLLAAVYPGAVGMSVFILSEAVFCPLMLLVLLVMARGLMPSRAAVGELPRGGLFLATTVGCGMSAGLISGLAVLSRPSWILWPAAVGLAAGLLNLCRPIRLSGGVSRLRWGVFWGCLAAAPWLPMAPWIVRNWQLTGRWVPTSLQVGASLYDGLHAGASGGSDEGMRFTELRLAKLLEQVESGEVSPDSVEWRLNQQLQREALTWASENRSDAARLGLLKLWRTWRPWPAAGQVGNRFVVWGEGILYLLIVALALLGLVVHRRDGWPVWIWGLPVPYYAAIHAVFVGSVRYRQPAVLALCVLAGLGVAWLWKWWAADRPFVVRKRTDVEGAACDGGHAADWP